jgi:hypothetical protein
MSYLLLEVSMILTLVLYFNVIVGLRFQLHPVSLEFVVPADRQWGQRRPDGSYTGLVGDVASGRAHMSACDVTVGFERRSAVDFSYGYFYEDFRFLTRAPVEANRAFVVLKPFSFQVPVNESCFIIRFSSAVYGICMHVCSQCMKLPLVRLYPLLSPITPAADLLNAGANAQRFTLFWEK